MGPNSRLLVHDSVLPDPAITTEAPQRQGDVAPEPLLPHFGFGNSRMHTMDINMMGMLNSKERTLGEFEALGAAAGFKLEKIWDYAETSVMEFVL